MTGVVGVTGRLAYALPPLSLLGQSLQSPLNRFAVYVARNAASRKTMAGDGGREAATARLDHQVTRFTEESNQQLDLANWALPFVPIFLLRALW